jgi:uncharacterized membrane protein
MKITKSYFNDENTLNKGYRESNDKDHKNYNASTDNSEILSLAAYEEISPGAMKRLLEIAEKEQAHQHDLEKINIKSNNRARYFGYFSGLVAILIISFFSFLMVGVSTIVGIMFIICSFGLMLGGCVVSYFTKLKNSVNDPQRNKNYFYNKNKEHRNNERNR